MFQLFSPLNLMFVIQDFCLPPHLFLRWGRMWAPGWPLWVALPSGFDREGQCKAGTPPLIPTKNMLDFLFSRAVHNSPGGGGNEADLWEVLRSFADHQWIAIKALVWGQLWKHCRGFVWRLGENQWGNGHWCISFSLSWLAEPTGLFICWHDVDSKS